MPPPESAHVENLEKKTNPILSAKVLAAVLLTAALFWFWYLYTGQIWEDFLITLRISRNAALGNGLVYSVGERIHGFTSPLNVLLPASILAANPALSEESVLTIYNIVATLLLTVAALPLYRRLIDEDSASSKYIWWLLPLAIGFNVKICSFATNGQEAAFTLAFLGLGLVALWKDAPNWWKWMGLSWGGLMWTRPDSPILIIGLSVAALLFPCQPRKSILIGLFKSAAVCTAIYLPWFVWADWYYGSPVPHTIIAKRMYYYNVSGSTAFWAKRVWLAFCNVLFKLFTPTYAECSTWPAWYNWSARALAVISCFYWFIPGRDRIGRTASVVCLAWMLYQIYTDTTARAFPWYFPAAGFCGAIVLFRVGVRLSGLGRWPTVGTSALAAAVFLFLGYGYEKSIEPTRLRQIHIENGIRKQIGLWLKENVGAEERIYLEPIGYIGYFSERKLYDYPGLVSPDVVRAIRDQGAGFDTCIEYLKPSWLVLRGGEAISIEQSTAILKAYELVAVFGPDPAFKELQKRDTSYALNTDSIFCIYRRRS